MARSQRRTCDSGVAITADSLADWRKRVRLLDATARAEFEEGERDKERGWRNIRELRDSINRLRYAAKDSGNAEAILLRALSGVGGGATGAGGGAAVGAASARSVSPGRLAEQKRLHVCDLRNRLNQLRVQSQQLQQRLQRLQQQQLQQQQPDTATDNNCGGSSCGGGGSAQLDRLQNRLQDVERRCQRASIVNTSYTRLCHQLQCEHAPRAAQLQLVATALQRRQAVTEQLRGAQRNARELCQLALVQYQQQQLQRIGIPSPAGRDTTKGGRTAAAGVAPRSGATTEPPTRDDPPPAAAASPGDSSYWVDHLSVDEQLEAADASASAANTADANSHLDADSAS